MEPTYNETKSPHGNDWQPTIEWVAGARELRISAYSGQLSGIEVNAPADRYAPTFPIAEPIGVCIYLVRDKDTGNVEYYVDERARGVGMTSLREAGLDSLALVAWFDFKAGDVAPSNFNAWHCVPVDQAAEGRRG